MRIMYDKILVAVDQSPASDRAVLAARDFGPVVQGGKCGCCTCVSSRWAAGPAPPPLETPDEANAEVATSVETLSQAGVKAHGMVRKTMYGHAAREIVADAIEHGLRRYRDGLAWPWRPGRAGHRQHRAQGHPPDRPTRPDRPLAACPR